MAILYKNRGLWYITASYENQRLTSSLRTKDKQVAKKLKPVVELELLEELKGVKTRKKSCHLMKLGINIFPPNTIGHLEQENSILKY